jgi:hypothetical protein
MMLVEPDILEAEFLGDFYLPNLLPEQLDVGDASPRIGGRPNRKPHGGPPFGGASPVDRRRAEPWQSRENFSQHAWRRNIFQVPRDGASILARVQWVLHKYERAAGFHDRAHRLPPKVHAKDLPIWRHPLTAQRNSIGILPNYAFEVPFARRTLLGVDAVLINDPEGIRHMMATNALRSGMTLASGCTVQ